MGIQQRNGEIIQVFVCMKQCGGGLSCADTEGDIVESTLNLTIAPVVQNTALDPECHIRHTWSEMKGSFTI